MYSFPQKHLFSGINRAGAKLLELDLSDNALGPVGVEGMVDFMCSPACYSLQVNIFYNYYFRIYSLSWYKNSRPNY